MGAKPREPTAPTRISPRRVIAIEMTEEQLSRLQSETRNQQGSFAQYKRRFASLWKNLSIAWQYTKISEILAERTPYEACSSYCKEKPQSGGKAPGRTSMSETRRLRTAFVPRNETYQTYMKFFATKQYVSTPMDSFVARKRAALAQLKYSHFEELN